MGYAIVKVDKDPADDRWIVWSSIVDAPVFTGDKEEVTGFFREEFGRSGIVGIDSRFLRATNRGSDSGVGRALWDCEPLRMTHKDGWVRIPRENLAAFWDRYEAWATAEEEGPEPDISDLVTPITDEED